MYFLNMYNNYLSVLKNEYTEDKIKCELRGKGKPCDIPSYHGDSCKPLLLTHHGFTFSLGSTRESTQYQLIIGCLPNRAESQCGPGFISTLLTRVTPVAKTISRT